MNGTAGKQSGPSHFPFILSEVEGRTAGGAVAFWAYMLRCADGRFYVGHTDALERRIGLHQSGKGCDFTARRLPVLLVWSETFPTREEALAAERQIKGWSRAKKEALIVGEWARVSELARSREARPSTSLRTNGGNVAGVTTDALVSTPDTSSTLDAPSSVSDAPSSVPDTPSSAPDTPFPTPDTPFVLSEVEARAPGEAPAPSAPKP